MCSALVVSRSHQEPGRLLSARRASQPSRRELFESKEEQEDHKFEALLAVIESFRAVGNHYAMRLCR